MPLSREQQLELYSRMLRIRRFEEALTQNRMGGHLSIGQEAAIAGACMALTSSRCRAQAATVSRSSDASHSSSEPSATPSNRNVDR